MVRLTVLTLDIVTGYEYRNAACHLRLSLLHEMVPIPMIGTVDVPMVVVSTFLSRFFVDLPRNMRIPTLFHGTTCDGHSFNWALVLSAAKVRALLLCTKENAEALEIISRYKKVDEVMLLQN